MSCFILLHLYFVSVQIHCSKSVDRLAQEKIKKHSYEDQDIDIEDHNYEQFIDESEDVDEIVQYGKREAIRANSPFFHFFMKYIENIENAEDINSSIDNQFYCPSLMKMIVKQYLSLYPLISACMLPQDGKGLRNNSYVELYREEQRRLLSRVPKRLLWPPQYLGMLNQDSQNKAGEILLKGFIPNIRTGGKAKFKKTTSFVSDMEESVFKAKQPSQVWILSS